MTVTDSNKPILGVAQRPLRRSNVDHILGGVCGGLAVRLGVRERTVRILFSLGVLLYGVGALLYIALWLLTIRSGESESVAARLTGRRRANRAVFLSVAVSLLAMLALYSVVHRTIGGLTWIFWVSAIGVFAVWRGSSAQERTSLQGVLNSAPLIGRASAKGWRAVALRVVPGVVMVTVGLHILNKMGGVWGAAVPALLGTIALLAGLLIILAPWWLQNARDLSTERRERVRAEERAAMVTHVHDSVLQTLTLIERVAGNEVDVIRLARAQERELREWLFNPDLVGSANDGDGSFVTIVSGIQGDIERDYGVKIELVTVGDVGIDDRVRALVAAGREATVNAAKWSGVQIVSMYAEVDEDVISLYVRDTGRGFDLDAIAPDRHGIALSIRQRMSQCGGSVTIRTGQGSGTEVQLELPRHPS